MWTHRQSGLTNKRNEQDHRNPYERDKTRIIHSPSFRRLQRKTQILAPSEGDFHRTRLTHSLEVASIGRSIVRNLAIKHVPSLVSNLLPHEDLISAICLLHDIGHPPYGHGGEIALNFLMRDYGGFEANGQTLRLLTKIEDSYGIYGLDLTRRTLLGILKYPAPFSKINTASAEHALSAAHKPVRLQKWFPPKGYFDCEHAEVQWILAAFNEAERSLFQSVTTAAPPRHAKTIYKSFDCSIMDIADDIAYGVHDLEDAIYLRLIIREQLDTARFHQLIANTSLATHGEQLLDFLFNDIPYKRKEAIGKIVNYLITSVSIETTNDNFENSLLKYNAKLLPEAAHLLHFLMEIVYQHVIDSPEARTVEYGGQQIILQLFEAINTTPGLLDKKNRELFYQAQDEANIYRIICDYIANMTDENARRMHERLHGFNTNRLLPLLGR